MFGYKEKDTILYQEAYPLEAGEVYGLWGRLAEQHRTAHQSSMESRWEVSKEGFFEWLKPRHIMNAGEGED